MFRSAIRAAPAARPRARRFASPSHGWTRFTSTVPRPARQQSSRKLWPAAGIVALTGSGAFFYTKSGTDIAAPVTASSRIPLLKDVASEDQIPVISPIKPLDLDDVNKKLREQAHTFVFESEHGSRGRVDVVRVPSNAPVEDEWDLAVGKCVNGGEALFAGVYDGHAGWATSRVLKEALIPHVSTALRLVTTSSSGEVIDNAIQDAFLRLDQRIFDNASKAMQLYKPGAAEGIAALAPAIAGSCALLTIYDPKSSILRTAVTGDSRAVRGVWSSTAGKFEADELSKDQTGFNEEEVARLDKAHPGEKEDILDPKSGRLLGMAVTRAFGDHRWKWSVEQIRTAKNSFYASSPRPNTKSPPYMTARPEVTTRKIQTEDFVIIASDGLWDNLTSEDAVTCVSRWLTAKKANKPEVVTEMPADNSTWRVPPECFAIEDLDNAAVCLAKNALGGARRRMLQGVLTGYSPMSRNLRDDITVQVIFFKDPE
ncbi:hypothetical protein G7046_g1477 [Stylonectria norvegica]|nr:hypothetical protein G7046_g1477 [Stylonectria norvegica]